MSGATMVELPGFRSAVITVEGRDYQLISSNGEVSEMGQIELVPDHSYDSITTLLKPGRSTIVAPDINKQVTQLIIRQKEFEIRWLSDSRPIKNKLFR